MSDFELLSRIENLRVVAAFIAVLAIGVEFAAGFAAKPVQRRLDAAQAAEIAQANARAAEANQKAEEERLARVKIEQRLAPRQLLQEDALKISKALDSYSTTIFILAFGDSPEIVRFAHQLAAALKEGGCKVGVYGAIGGADFTGVLVSPARGIKEVATISSALVGILTAAGFEATVYESFDPKDTGNLPAMVGPDDAPRVSDSSLRIFVGAK